MSSDLRKSSEYKSFRISIFLGSQNLKVSRNSRKSGFFNLRISVFQKLQKIKGSKIYRISKISRFPNFQKFKNPEFDSLKIASKTSQSHKNHPGTLVNSNISWPESSEQETNQKSVKIKSKNFKKFQKNLKISQKTTFPKKFSFVSLVGRWGGRGSASLTTEKGKERKMVWRERRRRRDTRKRSTKGAERSRRRGELTDPLPTHTHTHSKRACSAEPPSQHGTNNRRPWSLRAPPLSLSLSFHHHTHFP